MKKLLSTLLALFMSITNNVDYQPQNDVMYTANSYYTIEVDDAPDYRDMYGSVAVASREYSCKPATIPGKYKNVTYSDGETHVNACWIEAGVSMSFSEIPDESTYKFKSSRQIIIPYDGELLSSSATSDGTSMILKVKVDDDLYQLKLTGMDRWWCCMYRNEEHKVTDTLGASVWKHTCDELYGTTFSQGDIVGLSCEGTELEIYKYVDSKATKACTLKELYTH